MTYTEPTMTEDALCDALLMVFGFGDPRAPSARDSVRDHATEIIQPLGDDGVYLVEGDPAQP